MRDPIPLSEVYSINPRFTRSINLALDFSDEESLDGYLLTPLTLSVLDRLTTGLFNEKRNRAWTITGPYGTGKSACCLYLSKVFSQSTDPACKDARDRLKDASPKLHSEIEQGLKKGSLAPILVNGSRRAIGHALLEALDRNISQFGLTETFQKKVQKVLRQAERGKIPADHNVVEIFEEFVNRISAKSENAGVILIIDELGKLLEYSALHPEHSDVFLLQLLAELANRSGDKPILLVTVLHQAFDRYAAHLGREQQQEWAKIQGRFEDIGFFEGIDQLLTLVGNAIVSNGKPEGYQALVSEESIEAIQLGLNPRGAEDQQGINIYERCAPLHPVTSLLLPQLFRSRLAQNERSLFAFLSSSEPFGFKSFLADEKNAWSDNGYKPFYRLHKLYDYVISVFGSSLATLDEGKKWVEIADALERMPQDSSGVDEDVIKTIGLLNIFGDKQIIKASEDILKFALNDGEHVGVEDVQKSVVRLLNSGIVIYRKHQGAYSLWEGSDVDLNERYQEALSKLETTYNLAELIENHASIAPYVAKRHLYNTGTLRYFKPLIINEKELGGIEEPKYNFGGFICFVLPESMADEKATIKRIVEISTDLWEPYKEQILFAVPKEMLALRSSLEEILAWKWVSKNTPELESDRVARKELAARKSDAYARLDQLTSATFDKESAYRNCHWIHSGENLEFNSSRQLLALLSDICEDVFDQAPIVMNELVNREHISSSAAGGRRLLIDHMLQNPNKEFFGIEGTGPEKSIYISLFQKTGLHHFSKVENRWKLDLRKGPNQTNVAHMWRFIESWLTSAIDSKKKITDLYASLKRHPFGISEGLLPVFFLAKFLSRQSEVALYEEGAFVAEVTMPVIERLMKAPERFELQQFPLDGSKGAVIDKLVALLGDRYSTDQSTLINALRPIYSFISKLPQYSLTTREISIKSQEVREILINSKEPHRLLFEELPKALGSITNDEKDLDVDHYFSELKKALLELQKSYQDLLDKCQVSIADALGLSRDLQAHRDEIAERARIVVDVVSEMELKAFALRLSDNNLGNNKWLESVLDCVVGKIPSHWKDQDYLAFEVNLTDLTSRFRKMEDIAFTMGKKGAAGKDIIRLSIIDKDGVEASSIITVHPEKAKQSKELVDRLESLITEEQLPEDVIESAVAELTKRVVQRKER